MKKIIVAVLSLLVLSINFVYAQSSYEIYVHDVATSKTEYQVGDIVEGKFSISNLSDVPQSDIYYVISSGEYNKEELQMTSTRSLSEKSGPIYLKAQSKDVISFSYNLPKSLTGESALQITALLKDGTLVGQSDHPIKIKGEPTLELGGAFNANLVISDFDQIINTQSGPTVYENETINLNFVLAPTSKSYVLNPKITLYNRTDNKENIKEVIEIDSITTSSQEITEHTISLPTNLEPLVYYGVLSFGSEEVEISSIDFRYIISGPIATVRNVTTESLEVKKGDQFVALVTYGGQPFDELRPEKQIIETSATLTVTAFNEKGEQISTSTQSLDLTDADRTTSVVLDAQQNAKSISFTAQIRNSEGKELSSYQTSLPSSKEVKDQVSYMKKDISDLMIWVSMIILLFVIFVLIYIRKRHGNLIHTLLVLVVGLGTIGIIFGIRDTQAYETLYEYIAPKNVGHNLFHITSVSSPLPPQIKIYEPGETFNLSISASYGDCNNASQYFYAYMYKDGVNWWNETPAFQNTTSKQADYVYNVKYWVTNGVELFKQTYSSNNFEKIQWKIDTKAACKSIGGTWEDGSCFTESYSAKKFSFSKMYTAPTTPGFHKMYFGLFQSGDENDGNNGEDSHQHGIYYQEICVRGAGLCPNETVEPVLCPNLTGIITQDADGTINQDGQPTKYIINATGDCELPQMCDDSHAEGTEECIDGKVYSWACMPDGKWSRTDTGRLCEDTARSCTSSPSWIEEGEIATFIAYPSLSASYQWNLDSLNISGETGRIYEKTINNTGMYDGVSVDITIDGTTQNVSCSPIRVCQTKPGNGVCGAGDTYKNVYEICNADGTWTPRQESCGPVIGGDPEIPIFKFDPKIAGADGKCSFTLKAENVKSCTIKNRLGTEVAPFNPLSATPAGSIKETNRKLSIGTYSLECKKLDDLTYIHPDTISCSSNPNLEEF